MPEGMFLNICFSIVLLFFLIYYNFIVLVNFFVRIFVMFLFVVTVKIKFIVLEITFFYSTKINEY